MEISQQQTHQQSKVTPEISPGGEIYSAEFFIRGYVDQIQKIREYYLEHGWTKPNTINLRCLYNHSPQFRKMCDDDSDIHHVLQCLFRDEQQAWDTHYHTFLQRAESQLLAEPTEQESRTSPVCLSVSLRFLLDFWNDAHCAHQHLATLKTWLSDLYQGSNDATQKRIETEVLPILFDIQEIAAFFADWEENPNLQYAYRSAIQAPREQLPISDETGGLERSYRQALKEYVHGYVPQGERDSHLTSHEKLTG